MRHFLAGRPPAAIAGLPGGVVVRARGGSAGSAGSRPAAWRAAPGGHRPASSSDRPDHTGGTGRRPDGSLRGRRRRTGTSPRAPRARRGGWTITARCGKTRTRRIHAPCEIWPEGPGWQDSGPSPTSAFGMTALPQRALRPQAHRAGAGRLRVTYPEFRAFWRSPTGWGGVPELVVADPGFYLVTGEATAEAVGVKRVSVAHHRHEERPAQAGAEAA